MKKLFAIVTAFCMTATILPIRSDTGSNHPWIEANAAGNLSSYEEVLQTIYDSRSYDGAYFELIPGCNVQDNKFSLCDVDFDGQDELLVCWTEASANDRVEAIFDKNTSGRVYLKGETSPHDDLSWLSASQEYLKYS